MGRSLFERAVNQACSTLKNPGKPGLNTKMPGLKPGIFDYQGTSSSLNGPAKPLLHPPPEARQWDSPARSIQSRFRLARARASALHRRGIPERSQDCSFHIVRDFRQILGVLFRDPGAFFDTAAARSQAKLSFNPPVGGARPRSVTSCTRHGDVLTRTGVPVRFSRRRWP